MSNNTDTFNQTTQTLISVINTLREVIQQLQDDNQSLRTQLNLSYHRHDELPQASVFIEVGQDEEKEEELPRVPTYSIPPHIRQNYLRNLTDHQQCSICLQRINNDNTMELTNCGHIFHVNCIRRHRLNSQNCPVCRHNLNGI